ncbi:acetylglutamate kinase [Arenibacter troitsensis]|uniref:Acetylglutamate kinase n=1 Tax=Arenibacter troitsensis TaxID=188872 RepID=A0A1X7JSL2_9FLAO|nr:acetylglutamate kinase [Arenibacter troitsensis]SMG30782.1 N-acetylglutamate kinase [Arenibacter troitsensis]
MKQKLSIIKIGGNVIENETELNKFLDSFAAIQGPKILVHGGGKLATQIAEKLGIESKLVGGRRITDEEGLKVITMVYGGLANKNIVAQLQARGTNAIGLSGADGNTIRAVKRPVREIDYGFAGDVEEVNAGAIDKLLQADFVPVFCAITHNKEGQLLNTNADTIASEVAIGMSGNYDTTLYYCFEKKGVLMDISDETSVVKHLEPKNYQELLEKKIIADGMLPKLENCFHALHKNVGKVCIGDLDMLNPIATLFTTITL